MEREALRKFTYQQVISASSAAIHFVGAGLPAIADNSRYQYKRYRQQAGSYRGCDLLIFKQVAPPSKSRHSTFSAFRAASGVQDHCRIADARPGSA